jgi:hypothetical protein
MYNLFKKVSPILQGIIKFPEWYYVRDQLKRNLGTVISYYRKNPTAVPSSHFLVRLLQSITVPQSQNLERYYNNVDAMCLNLSMALKMTSSIYAGSVFNGVFYGQDSKEILVVDNEAFNYFEAHKNWQNLCPVKVLSHSMSDLSLNLPDGHKNGSETGLAVISINITLLAVQYRAFRLNEIMTVGNSDSQKSIMQFIRMYVIPNMLFSHLDYALFNRMLNKLTGAPLGEGKKIHSFYLTDYDNKIDAIQEKFLDNFLSTNKDFATIMKTIPMVTKDNLEEVLLLPDIAPTRQIDWALAISRLPALTFLFLLLKATSGNRNQADINSVLYHIRMYKSSSLMRNQLPMEMYYDIQDQIDFIERTAME